jgi:hypothetical protein
MGWDGLGRDVGLETRDESPLTEAPSLPRPSCCGHGPCHPGAHKLHTHKGHMRRAKDLVGATHQSRSRNHQRPSLPRFHTLKKRKQNSFIPVGWCRAAGRGLSSREGPFGAGGEGSVGGGAHGGPLERIVQLFYSWVFEAKSLDCGTCARSCRPSSPLPSILATIPSGNDEIFKSLFFFFFLDERTTLAIGRVFLFFSGFFLHVA